MEQRPWTFECKLCRAKFEILCFGWPCKPELPEHDTFHDVTARRIRCIGSRCVGRVLGERTAAP
jgi:hypothetical protein